MAPHGQMLTPRHGLPPQSPSVQQSVPLSEDLSLQADLAHSKPGTQSLSVWQPHVGVVVLQVPGLSPCLHIEPHGHTIAFSQVPVLQSLSPQHCPAPRSDCALHMDPFTQVSPFAHRPFVSQQPVGGGVTTQVPNW